LKAYKHLLVIQVKEFLADVEDYLSRKPVFSWSVGLKVLNSESSF